MFPEMDFGYVMIPYHLLVQKPTGESVFIVSSDTRVRLFTPYPLIQRNHTSLLLHMIGCLCRDHLQVCPLEESRRIGSLRYNKASRQNRHTLKHTHILHRLLRLTLFDKMSDGQRNTEPQTLSGMRRTSLRSKHDGNSRASSLFLVRQHLLHTSCADRAVVSLEGLILGFCFET